MSNHPSSLVAEVAGMRTRAVELAETLWAAHQGGELMELVAEVEALKSTLDALELAATRELEATGAVKATGWASTQDFLTRSCGWPPPPSGRPSSSATTTAASRTAPVHRSCVTPTTSLTGSTAVPPRWTTCCSSADTTTA